MATVHYAAVSHEGRRWSPGFFRSLPVTGIAALVIAILGIAGSVAILVISDGQLLAKWGFAPTVYLSIASTITNAALNYALAEAVKTAWWRKALRTGTRINDLHRYWAFGNSLMAASMSGRHVNLVAVACILAAIAPINGPLLQRASTVSIEDITSVVDLDLAVAAEIPQQWYTGYVSGRGYNVSLYTANFTPIASGYSIGAPISLDSTGCSGICKTRVTGIGLTVNCSSFETDFTLIYDAENPLGVSQPVVVNGTTVFDTHFAWSMLDYGDGTAYGQNNFTLFATYKHSDACNGTLINQVCSLRLAQVEYPVVIDTNKSTVALDPSTTVYDDLIGSPLNDSPARIQGPNFLAGFWLALQNKWSSTSHLRWVGAVGYELTGTGFSTAASYAILSKTDYTAGTDCALHFRNPLDDMIQSARDLFFRTSVGAAQTEPGANTQHIPSAQQAVSTGVYRSHYAYLAGATAASVLATIFVTVLFHGFWEIGRPTSLSPIETAKAFNAPLLRGCDSNAKVDEVLSIVGEKAVRYGAVVINSTESSSIEGAEILEADQSTTERARYGEIAYHGGESSGGDDRFTTKLMVLSPELVNRPAKGQRFSG